MMATHTPLTTTKALEMVGVCCVGAALLKETRDAPVLDSDLRGTSCQLSALRD